jgi:hypothetical protein
VTAKKNRVKNISLDCNPGASYRGELDNFRFDVPSLNMVETCSRPVHERAKERWTDFRRGSKDIHILKKCVHNESVGEPMFVSKVVQ